jgi:hypothetical protein
MSVVLLRTRREYGSFSLCTVMELNKHAQSMFFILSSCEVRILFTFEYLLRLGDISGPHGVDCEMTVFWNVAP